MRAWSAVSLSKGVMSFRRTRALTNSRWGKEGGKKCSTLAKKCDLLSTLSHNVQLFSAGTKRDTERKIKSGARVCVSVKQCHVHLVSFSYACLSSFFPSPMTTYTLKAQTHNVFLQNRTKRKCPSLSSALCNNRNDRENINSPQKLRPEAAWGNSRFNRPWNSLQSIRRTGAQQLHAPVWFDFLTC